MNKTAIVRKVEDILRPLLESERLTLVDIGLHHDRRGWVLRVFIDKTNGVTLDDCVQVRHFLLLK